MRLNSIIPAKPLITSEANGTAYLRLDLVKWIT